MPLHLTPTDPEQPRADPEAGSPEQPQSQPQFQPQPEAPSANSNPDPNAPLSVVPHNVPDTSPSQPIRIRTARGEMDEYELIHFIDSIEDERARGRFRESIYISLFIWIAIAWVVLYGPRYLWHAPKLVTPFDVLKERQLTELTNPNLTHHLHTPRPAPKVDTHTLERLRSEEPKIPPPSRTSPAPSNTPAPAASIPNTAPPVPSPAAPLPSAPPPVVAEAPTPHPSTRPDFNTGNSSASNAIQDAIRNAARNPGSGGSVAANAAGGALGTGVDILSDTQGVNFDPYIRRILREIYDQWIPLIPEEAHPPLSKSGITMIRFSILPDGRIGAMHLDGSTHDDALNRAAWGSIVGVGQFPPLPSQFHGPNLELRIHYLVNRQHE